MTIGITDLIIGCFLLLAGFNGWRTGLVRQIVTVVALFLSYFLAKSFTWMVEPYVAKYVSVPTVSNSNLLSLVVNQQTNSKLQSGLSFVLLFLLFFFAIKFIGRVIDALARMPGLSGMNRIIGLVVGTVLGFFIAALVCNVLYLIPHDQLHAALANSKLASLMIEKYSFFLPKSFL